MIFTIFSFVSKYLCMLGFHGNRQPYFWTTCLCELYMTSFGKLSNFKTRVCKKMFWTIAWNLNTNLYLFQLYIVQCRTANENDKNTTKLFVYNSPVKLCGNLKQIATRMLFCIFVQGKHYNITVKSRTKSENMKFDFCMFDDHELAC